MPRILFFSAKPYDREFFDEANREFGFELEYYETHLGPHIAHIVKSADAVCVFVNDRLVREVIEILAERGVRIIALRCAGYNNVDLEAAREKGIQVCRVPGYSPEAVAEHALAMILTLNRKTHKAYNRVREQNFSLNGLLGFNLHGKSVGIVGTGKIGGTFARIMLGLGCQVLAFDRYPDPELRKQGVVYVELPDLLSRSDIISLHCPLTEETHHLINGERLSLVKRGAMLINTGRGGLIDSRAIIDALKSGQIGSLGLDVYEQEGALFFRDLSSTIIADDTIQRLMSFPNVLITAHQAFFTREALGEIARTTLTNIQNILEGKEAFTIQE